MKPKDKKAKTQCILKTKELEMSTGLEITSLFFRMAGLLRLRPSQKASHSDGCLPKAEPPLQDIHHFCSLQTLRSSDWGFHCLGVIFRQAAVFRSAAFSNPPLSAFFNPG